MNIFIDGLEVSLELLDSQSYRNMEVIPIRMNNSKNQEFLTLKRGMDAGVVEITECEMSTVGTVLARNNANIPLLLIDGDEILGAKQNRIMNRSLIIPPKTNMAISVSCTERGRWHYESPGYTRDFDDFSRGSSDYSGDRNLRFNRSVHTADFATRSAKSRDLFENRDCQSTVWNSIDKLENRTSFKSRTSALSDNYEHLKPMHEEYLTHFKIEFGQVGAVFIINGQIKGLELFYSPSVYQDYHEKIFRSYIMEAMFSDLLYGDNIDGINGFDSRFGNLFVSRVAVERFLREIRYSEFRNSDRKGRGKHVKFANNYGTGAALINNGELVHMAYFNSSNSKIGSRRDSRRSPRRYGSFREFSDNY